MIHCTLIRQTSCKTNEVLTKNKCCYKTNWLQLERCVNACSILILNDASSSICACVHKHTGIHITYNNIITIYTILLLSLCYTTPLSIISISELIAETCWGSNSSCPSFFLDCNLRLSNFRFHGHITIITLNDIPHRHIDIITTLSILLL